jgi:probable rRNA maturation factor
MIHHRILITRRSHDDRRVFSSPYIRKCINTALECEDVNVKCEISVLITDDEEIHSINAQFRNVDRATDVLSFPMQNLTPENFDPDMMQADPESGILPLGDIVISVDRIKAQAEEFGHSRRRELSYLLVHSVMHLLGYDHVDEGKMKKQMRCHEDAVMTVLKR